MKWELRDGPRQTTWSSEFVRPTLCPEVKHEIELGASGGVAEIWYARDKEEHLTTERPYGCRLVRGVN